MATAAKIINGSDNTGFSSGSNFFLKEAYLDYLFPLGKGLTITVGKFVTPMGAEVIESNANWNYSRGLLFDYAIPFLHFGANAKYTFNPKWALTGYLVNGWNNTVIDHDVRPPDRNLGHAPNLTYGVSVAYTPNAKWSVTENYFAGPVTDAYRRQRPEPQRLEADIGHRYRLYAKRQVGIASERRLWFRTRDL